LIETIMSSPACDNPGTVPAFKHAPTRAEAPGPALIQPSAGRRRLRPEGLPSRPVLSRLSSQLRLSAKASPAPAYPRAGGPLSAADAGVIGARWRRISQPVA